jgi:hypothetical protein
MAWPERPTKNFSQSFSGHKGGVIFSVDLRDRRLKEDIHPGLFALFLVSTRIPRVLVKVFSGSELGGIHKDADHDGVNPLSGCPYQ